MHAPAEIAEIGMPERDVEEDRLESALPTFGHHFLPHARRPETAAMGPNKRGHLRHVTDKEQGQEVRLVDDLVQPESLGPVETRPFEQIDHFSDDRAGQIARRGQLQTIAIGCVAEQDQRVACDSRCGDFDVGEVVCKTKRAVVLRRLTPECIQALQFEQRPSRFDATKPATHFGIAKESR